VHGIGHLEFRRGPAAEVNGTFRGLDRHDRILKVQWHTSMIVAGESSSVLPGRGCGLLAKSDMDSGGGGGANGS
jgi:hypothetical protein